MNTPSIKIENFERFEGEILTEDQNGKQHIIDEVAFGWWLLRNDKLNWCIDLSLAGEHQQLTGVSTIEEYFDHQGFYHLTDIAEFLESKQALQPSLKSIN